MAKYIHQLKNWPQFTWNNEAILPLLSNNRHKQGRLEKEMKLFLKWLTTNQTIDAVIKSAIAHFWFVTIHPFDAGNGRIAKAIADRQLTRSDEDNQQFYSMSAHIRLDRTND